MSSLTLTPPRGGTSIFHRAFRDEPVFAGTALVLAATMIPTLLAWSLDQRLVGMENPWIKPLKFQISLAIYTATLAFYARWLPEAMRARRVYRLYTWGVVAAIAAESVWINGAAAFGVASHFNDASEIMFLIYNAMGALAVILTSASLVYGVAIWRNAASGLSLSVRTALGLGLVMTLPLTLVTAGYMSALSDSLIGTPVTHQSVPLMGWSTEVGDLRVSHFFATHAMHIVPFAAVLIGGTRRTAWFIATGFALCVIATFVQALNGRPFLAI